MLIHQFNRILDGHKLTNLVVTEKNVEPLFDKAKETFPINLVKEQII